VGLLWKSARRVIVVVVATTVLPIGLAMLVLPGPAVAVIPVGLGILATEFLWARRYLRRIRDRVGRLRPGHGLISRACSEPPAED